MATAESTATPDVIGRNTNRCIGLSGVTVKIQDGPTIALGGIQSVRPRVGSDGRLATLAIRTLSVPQAEMIAIGSVVEVSARVAKDAYGKPFEPPIVHSYGRFKVVYNHPRLEHKAYGVQTIVMVPVV
jgi:hypothetical protein